MISYEAYKLIHIFGILLLVFSLGGASLAAIYGGADRGRRLIAVTHGVALVIILTGGFGLMARIGVVHGVGWPLWIWGKLAIWLLLAGVIFFIRKRPSLAMASWLGIPILGVLAGYLAIYKPGM
jgi:hypothetical protein